MSNLRAQRALLNLGRNIKQARLTRRLAMIDLAERAGVSEKTIQRLERGDAGVGIGKLAGVLAALGEPDALAKILRIEEDTVGLSLALDAIPKRGISYVKRSGARAPDSRHKADGDDDEGVGF
ncbi:helix-turn-helix transcriptional regulator [uncultured Sulfitobacter sp.]|uniref:helix-turn-helix domain-containing protein n=1 Tax=uncultured Sulfitobacter sp. TaxID=191468 RepID=UPI000C64AF01|nr:transcriptional regulator [Sulfitobacter sp.]